MRNGRREVGHSDVRNWAVWLLSTTDEQQPKNNIIHMLISVRRGNKAMLMTCYETVKRASQSAGVKGLVCMICANWAFSTSDCK